LRDNDIAVLYNIMVGSVSKSKTLLKKEYIPAAAGVGEELGMGRVKARRSRPPQNRPLGEPRDI